MNWQKEAINDLKTYTERKTGIKNLKEKISILEDRYVSLSGVSCGEPVKGGTSKQEDKLINNIDERTRLSSALREAERIVGIVDNALSTLSEQDKDILTLFYIDRPSDYRDRLCDKYFIEEAQLYRLKDAALKRFTRAMYGIIEI